MDDVVGPVTALLTDAFTSPSAPHRMVSVLVTGPQGTGKSSLLSALEHHFTTAAGVFALVLDCSRWIGKRPELVRKHLTAAFDVAQQRQPALIMFDGLELLCPAVSAEQPWSESARSNTMVEALEGLMRTRYAGPGSRMAFVATCATATKLNKLLVKASFFDLVGKLKPPSAADRGQMLAACLTAHNSVGSSRGTDIDTVAWGKRLEGYTAEDVNALVQKAAHAAAVRSLASLASSTSAASTTSNTTSNTMTSTLAPLIAAEDLAKAEASHTPVSFRGVKLFSSEVSWSDIGGLRDVKKELAEMILWPTRYANLFASCPLRLRSGLLLYGPPGTGKTMMAAAASKECGLRFISVKGPELLNKYIGASEQAVRDLFERAQAAAPSILFFDEFDSIAPPRGHDSTGVTDRVVNQLLTQLDGVETLQGVYVLAATSRPDLVDPALLRPGRLDKLVYCGFPGVEDREEILRVLSRQLVLDGSVDLAAVAQLCEGFSGADLKALLTNAQLSAAHDLLDGIKTGRGSSREGEEEQTQVGDSNDTVYSFDAEGNLVATTQQIAASTLPQSAHLESSSSSSSTTISSTSPATPIVTQAHLLQCVRGLRPSVSEQERHRYQHLYESFLQARGGTAADSSAPAASKSKKVTLA